MTYTMTKVLVVLFTLSLSGCASAYRYNNVTYQTSNEALQAARADFSKAVNNVKVRSTNLGDGLRVVTPDNNLIEKNGVVVSGNAQRAQIEYIRDILMSNFASMVEGIRRSGLFRHVEHSFVSSTFNQEIGDHDALLVLHTPAPQQFQWFLYMGANGANKTQINFDASAPTDLQLASFVDNLEKAFKASGTNSRDQRSDAQHIASSHATSTGTGFFVNSNGYILTNHHVVDTCAALKVKNSMIGETAATAIAKDPRNDLAVIKIEIGKSPFARFRDSKLRVKQGEDIAVFGFPYSGLLSSSGNFAEGIISALSGIGEDSRFYQISAPVQPGNSGGAMVDEHGNVVGIITAKLNALKVATVTGDIPQNINFAIKSGIAQIFLGSNGIDFVSAKAGPAKSKIELAEDLQSYSALIECY